MHHIGASGDPARQCGQQDTKHAGYDPRWDSPALGVRGLGMGVSLRGDLVGAAIATLASAIPFVSASRDQWQVITCLGLAVFGAWTLAQRTVDTETMQPTRSKAVFSQQVQMARFLSEFEPGASVAANDIGAMNFYADIDCLDLVGQGDRDVFWMKRKRAYTTAALARLASTRGVKIALVYDSWFTVRPLYALSGPPLPPSWIRVERWCTAYGFCLGGDSVLFYAVNPSEAAKLKSSLDLFAPSLPPDVEVLAN